MDFCWIGKFKEKQIENENCFRRLECRDFNRGKSEISFYILGKSKKTFSLWVKRGYYGDCTFLFDFAYFFLIC